MTETTLMKGAWTLERVETLKKLFDAGLSMGGIAAELGTVSRNAVCGKVARLGLSRIRLRKSKPERAARPKRYKPSREPLREANEEVSEPLVQLDNVIPILQRISLFELTDKVCHWPIGTPGQEDFCFCGNPSLTGLPYCPGHTRLAYRPPEVRNDIRASH